MAGGWKSVLGGSMGLLALNAMIGSERGVQQTTGLIGTLTKLVDRFLDPSVPAFGSPAPAGPDWSKLKAAPPATPVPAPTNVTVTVLGSLAGAAAGGALGPVIATPPATAPTTGGAAIGGDRAREIASRLPTGPLPAPYRASDGTGRQGRGGAY